MIVPSPTYKSFSAALLATAFASQTAAKERISCELRETCESRDICDGASVSLSFDIDPNHFVSAVNANEPPYRKVTHVKMGNERFMAEPFLIKDTRGFWAEQNDAMFVVRADGRATFADTNSGRTLTGLCEDQQ